MIQAAWGKKHVSGPGTRDCFCLVCSVVFLLRVRPFLVSACGPLCFSTHSAAAASAPDRRGFFLLRRCRALRLRATRGAEAEAHALRANCARARRVLLLLLIAGPAGVGPSVSFLQARIRSCYLNHSNNLVKTQGAVVGEAAKYGGNRDANNAHKHNQKHACFMSIVCLSVFFVSSPSF